MSFHFDARGDSSDDDEGGGLDILAWKAGNAPRNRPAQSVPVAPVAPMVVPDDDEEDEDNSRRPTPDLAAFQSSRKRKSSSAAPSRSPPVPSFQAINERLPDPDQGSTYDLESLDSDILQLPMDEEEGVPVPAGKRQLVVWISRNEVDRDDFEDFTAASYAVERVLRERRLRNGKMMYRVMFEDTHTEEVRWIVSPSSLTTFPRGV